MTEYHTKIDTVLQDYPLSDKEQEIFTGYRAQEETTGRQRAVESRYIIVRGMRGLLDHLNTSKEGTHNKLEAIRWRNKRSRSGHVTCVEVYKIKQKSWLEYFHHMELDGDIFVYRTTNTKKAFEKGDTCKATVTFDDPVSVCGCVVPLAKGITKTS